jgi:hypothetical protein
MLLAVSDSVPVHPNAGYWGMPKRSNEFQKLVLLIERQLADTGTRIEESAMISDIDGTRREVDILLRVPVGQREILIGIECREHKRRADVPWIDYIKGRFEFLGVDRRVAVARSGFSKAALAKAKILNIETLTFERASKLNWAAKVAEVSGIQFEDVRFIHDDEVTLETVKQAVAPVWPTGSLDIPLTKPDGATESLNAFVDRFVSSEKLAMMLDSAQRNHDVPLRFRLRINLAKGHRARDANGVEHELRHVLVPLMRLKQRQVVQLAHSNYGRAAVATGSGKLGPAQLSVTLTEKEGQLIKGEVVIQEDGKEETVELRGLNEARKTPVIFGWKSGE